MLKYSSILNKKSSSIIYYEVDILKPMKKKVSITLDEDLIEKVKTLAENCDRSFSQYINLTVKEHVNEQENKE